MKPQIDPITATLRRGECIGLDAEFTGASEMLELSVYDLSLEVIFESLFRPARSQRWSKVPHGITPAMVKGCPRFAWKVPRVQRIIDRCRYMVGFALENDISHLRAEGVVRLETKRVLDLRDWFWLVFGRHHGFDYREGVSLSVITEILGVGKDDGRAHRAGYDTECTLICFRELLGRFLSTCAVQPDTFDDAVAMFGREFDAAMAVYRKECAAGFVSLMLSDDGRYVIKANKLRPDMPENLMECVAVADRHEAMDILAETISGRVRRSNRIIIDAVTPDVIEAIRSVSDSGS